MLRRDDPRFKPPWRHDRTRPLPQRPLPPPLRAATARRLGSDPGPSAALPWDDHLAAMGHVSPPTTGAAKMLIVLASFSDTPLAERFTFKGGYGQDVPAYAQGQRSPVMPAGAASFDAMHEVNAWYKAASGGRFHWSNWTYAHVVLNQKHPGTSASNNYYNWCPHGAGHGFDGVMNDALHQLMRRGCRWHYHNFDFHAVVFPNVPGCHGAVAHTPGTTSFYNGYTTGSAAVDARTMVHELGHNLGLHHARHCYQWGCDEYGDYTDIMGKGRTHFNAAYMHYLDWLQEEDVTVVRRSGLYRVFPADAALEVRDDSLRLDARLRFDDRDRTCWTPRNRTRALVLERDMTMSDTYDIREPSREYIYAWIRSQPGGRDGVLDGSRGLTFHRLQRKEPHHDKDEYEAQVRAAALALAAAAAALGRLCTSTACANQIKSAALSS